MNEGWKDKEALKEYVGFHDLREFWKTLQEHLEFSKKRLSFK